MWAVSGTCSHRADSSKRCTSTTLVTTQMRTQTLLATVSLCVLCETAVRSRPCAQLLCRSVPSTLRLMTSELHARSRPTQREAGHQKSIIGCSFRLFKLLYPHEVDDSASNGLFE